MARNPAVPRSELLLLLSAEEGTEAAKNPGTRYADIEPFLRGGATQRRVAAAFHGLSLDDAARLANDPDESVRAELASNETVAGEILSLLVRDPSDGVRGWALSNPSVPPVALSHLPVGVVPAWQVGRYVEAVIPEPQMRQEVLTRAFDHPHLTLRRAVRGSSRL